MHQSQFSLLDVEINNVTTLHASELLFVGKLKEDIDENDYVEIAGLIPESVRVMMQRVEHDEFTKVLFGSCNALLLNG